MANMDFIANVGVYQNMVNLLVCPLTGKLFLNPVIAEDGVVYEKAKIFIHLLENEKSPTTGEKVGLNYKNVYPIKSLVNDFVEKFPHLLKFQYKPEPEDDKIKKLYLLNKNKVHSLINNSQYDSLTHFIKFDLKSIGRNKLQKILKNAKNDVIKHVLDNCVNINAIIPNCSCGSCPSSNWKVINHVCINANSEIVKYIIDMDGVDLESDCGDRWRPIHQLSSYEQRDSEIIKYLISKGVDLFCENNDGYTPLELFCRYNKLDVIVFALNKIEKLELDLVYKLCERLNSGYVRYIKNEENYELKQLIKSKIK